MWLLFASLSLSTFSLVFLLFAFFFFRNTCVVLVCLAFECILPRTVSQNFVVSFGALTFAVVRRYSARFFYFLFLFIPINHV